MQRVWEFTKKIFHNIDPVLFVCASLLSLISILTVWGAVDNFGQSKLTMQIAMFILGVIVTVVIASVDFRAIIDRFWVHMLIGSILLLLITLLFGSSGESRETANQSWLKIPFTGLMIQPSEFVKFTFICTFSKHLFTVREEINKPKNALLLMGHAALVVGPILLSGDLGVALVYTGIILLMLFCAGLHPWYFAGIFAFLLILFPFLWEHLADYQRERIIVGFNPELDPSGKGLQPLRSRAAIAAGGFFGQGLFTGGIYEDLAASHTDFIFATVCEKLGFLGGAIVMILFMILVVRIFMLAKSAASTDYGGLICVGVGAMLIVQILINIGMCLAMMPVIGITLPFLSCGGSSMLATFMMFGLLHNVYAHSHGVRLSSARDTFDIDISLLNS